MDKTAIRPAATVVALRDFHTPTPRVLMGQRGAKAAFMPNKFVFPGGAVDPGDHTVPLANSLNPSCATRLEKDNRDATPTALATAAIRELWEETGLVLGQLTHWDAPPDWSDFAPTGLQPCAQNLHFFFRALTPPGRTRRFDARFFLVDADTIHGDLDDFSRAEDELAHLQWVTLDQARTLNLPFITQIVLGEIAAMQEITSPNSVPFFKNMEDGGRFLRL